ncbi:flavin reductase family protein, partial [Kocuria sp. M1R5S2]|uniref:2Fe-2S iron-sulfur cluster-binding protein n=1 Tax=Kocuria rhizosphaerae TaxID=3376285 RepID=UPI003793D1F2
DWRDRAAYACGPADFLDAAESLWQREEGQLRVERFAAPVAPGTGGAGGRVTYEKSDAEVDSDGATTLLAAGEDAGLMMRSGCRMGICHACVTPLLSGQVRDTRTGEVHGEPGHLVQTCVSTAAGPVSLDA